ADASAGNGSCLVHCWDRCVMGADNHNTERLLSAIQTSHPQKMLSSLTACSSIGFPTHCRLKSGLKLGADRPARHARSHVNASKLGHECLPHSLAACFKKLGADRELPGRWSESTSPSAHVGQQGDKLNRRFREAVNRLLFVGWVVGAQEETGLDQTGKPVCQDIRRDSFFG